MMAAVFCSFFAAMDDPVPAIRGFLKFTLWSMPLGALYVLVVIPAVHNFETLLLLCAPTFLFLGCFVARPATMGAGMATLFGVAGALTLHDTGQADFAGYLNAMLAQIVGIVTAVVVTATFRSVGAEWSVRRLRRATWRELAEMAAGAPEAVQPRAWAVRAVDRISLLAPRLAQRDAERRFEAAERALRDLRVGSDLAVLQALRTTLPAPRIAALLQGVAAHYRERLRLPVTGDDGDARSPRSRALREELDAVLAVALTTAQTPVVARSRAVTALVGLRRNLFPDAAAPWPAALQGAQP